jgi:poly-gamma-glutamate capsule biosynthesis protein CapA/YwtB (metallophosphatase superfamily)
VADRAWFKVKTQDFDMSDFFNPNSRCWNYYLNVVKMYNYSFFANAVVFATALPQVDAEDIAFADDAPTSVTAGKKIEARVITDPVNATSAITYSTSSESYASVAPDPNDARIAVITGVAEGTATITATCNGHTDTLSVAVSASE